MKMINKLRASVLIIFTSVSMIFSSHLNAQIPATLTLSAPTSGQYTATQSITLLPGFSTTGNFSAFISSGTDQPLVSKPSGDQNYTVINIIKTSGISNVSQLSALTIRQLNQTVQYFDGLGRPLQTVQVQASPGFADVVTPFAYDENGREPLKFLPYTVNSTGGTYRSDALQPGQGINAFYTNPQAGLTSTAFPYSKSVFELSPLNRIVDQGNPGSAWQPASGNTGHTSKTAYATNSSDFPIRLYRANAVSTTGHQYERTLSTSGLYTNGQLNLTIQKDENWVSADGKAGTIEEYKNEKNQIVLKRATNKKADGNLETLSTYYVYDDLGNLSFVLPPGANPDDGLPSQDALDKFCYQYRYDARHRLVEKSIPGQDGWTEQVFNQLNQIVFAQDPVQRGASKRSFIKYDVLGRIIMTGLVTSSTDSRIQIQNAVDSWTTNWEHRDNSNSFHRYSNLTGPSDSQYMDVHTVNYYDDYYITGMPAFSVTGFSAKTKGLLTATKVKVIGTTATYLWTINCYDDKGRVVKQYKQHYLSGDANESNYDEIANTYSFAGELLTTNRIHHAGTAATTIANVYTYDQVGRKQLTKETITGGAEVVLSKMEYNEVGQLLKKSLHSTDNGNSFLQNSNYLYNERGWLKKNTSNQFSYELQYQDGTNPQYNGNISGQLWGTAGNNTNNFIYSYDKINRLLNGTSTGVVMSEALTYDVMGNIKSLTRDGGNPFVFMHSGNRLNTISGGNLTATGTYVYDANGNATKSGRDSVLLTYNDLNLPATAVKSSAGVNVGYVYNALGQKLRKTSGGVTRNYIDGIEYNTGADIEIIHTDEGLARKNGASYSYEYNLTDHLGNVRYSFYKNPVGGALEQLQKDDYYPLGVRKIAIGGSNKYLYNGKELQEEFGQYDYGARFYDPVIGRWNVVDPLAEKSRRFSPYVYGKDNPIVFIDPDGMFDEFFTMTGRKIGEDEKGQNGIVRIVSDDKEIARIKSNTKEGKITNSGDVISGISTTKTILSEALNVLNRTIGLSEEASTVSNEGVINRMAPGGTEPEEINGVKVASIDITIPSGEGNTSIHSHPMDVLKAPNGQEFSVRASKVGPNDPTVFRHFSQNVIVGNLELPSYDTNGQLVKPATGAVFYDRNSVKINNITKEALLKIIKP